MALALDAKATVPPLFKLWLVRWLGLPLRLLAVMVLTQ